jgi:hypothetical protein
MAMPAPPSPPAPRMKAKRWPWILGMVVSLFVGIGIGAAATPEEGQPLAQPQAIESPTSPSVTPVEETEAPNLDGTWRVTSCDLQLFVGGGDLSTLVAAVEVKNTGNVPALITVSLKWDALPGPLIDGGTKQVRLNPDGTREVRFTKTRLSTDDVSRVQSSPGYKSSSDEKFCKVKTSIDNA